MKVIKGIGIGLILLTLIYVLGPKPKTPDIDNSPMKMEVSLSQLPEMIETQENNTPFLKPNNQARIVWADSASKKTEYAIVYLHGFSASQAEGSPIHKEMAEKYAANLYLSRLSGHGTNEPEPFENLSVEKLISTAKEAIAIGKLLGEKVIVMSCSTGGTLALYLAAGDPEIAGLILYSPNIDLYDKSSELVTGPWGLQIARLVTGDKQREFQATDEVKKYWTTKYRLEGIVQLKLLVETTMKSEIFNQVSQPTLVGYYYKNDEQKDKIISIERILQMYNQLGTSEDKKSIRAFPDVGNHAINSQYYSKDLESVRKETEYFLENTMGLTSKPRD